MPIGKSEWAAGPAARCFPYDPRVAAATAIEREVKLESDGALDLDRLGGEPLERRSFVSTYHDTPERPAGAVRDHAAASARERPQRLAAQASRQRRAPRGRGARRAEPRRRPAISDLLAAFTARSRARPAGDAAHDARGSARSRRRPGIAEVVSDDVAVLDGQQGHAGLRRGRDRADRGRSERAQERRARGEAARRATHRRRDEDRPRPRSCASPSRGARRPTPNASSATSPNATSICSPPIPASGSASTRRRCTTCASRSAACARCFARPGTCSSASGPTVLRDELGWLGRALGPLRDLDVLTAHLREEAAELDDEDRARIGAGFRRARKRITQPHARMRSTRFRASATSRCSRRSRRRRSWLSPKRRSRESPPRS